VSWSHCKYRAKWPWNFGQNVKYLKYIKVAFSGTLGGAGMLEMRSKMRPTLDEIKQGISVLDMARELGLDIKKSGSSTVAKCFHGERTPSLTFYPEDNEFHCFGCKAGGSVIDLYILAKGCDDKTAIRELAERMNGRTFQPAKLRAGPAPERKARQGIDLADQFEAFWESCLPINDCPAAYHYLGGPRETGGRDLYSQIFIDPASPFYDTVRAAATIRAKLPCGIGPLWSNRLVIAYRHRGRIVNLQGRAINGRGPKYLFPENVQRIAYNMDILSQPLDEIWIAEGFFDWLALTLDGYKAIAAGSAGTETLAPLVEQIKKIPRIVIAFDSDKAGNKGAKDLATLIGRRLERAKLPDGMDVAEYLGA
jgi:DNA primase